MIEAILYLCGRVVVCATAVICLILILNWLKVMSISQLPHFVIGHLEPKETAESSKEPNPIGFTSTESETTEKELSDKEQKEQILKDTASTISALLRGELDFDEL